MIDHLRRQLRDVNERTRALAAECEFGRVRDQVTRVATTLKPTVSQETQAAANHKRLTQWSDAVSSVLRRRGIATDELEGAMADLRQLVLLERRDVGRVTRTRWRAEFERSLDRATQQLEQLVHRHARAFLFPYRQPRPGDVFRLHVAGTEKTAWHVTAFGAGETTTESIDIPFKRSELIRFLTTHFHPDAAKAEAGALDSMRAFGERLFRAVFSRSIGSLFQRIRLDAVRRVRDVHLRIEASGEGCRAVPWEVLHDGLRFLSLSNDVLMMRMIGEAPAAGSPLPQPLRILLTTSSPHGVDGIDDAGVTSSIVSAFAPLVTLGLVDLDIACDGSIDMTRRLLRSGLEEGRPHHVWHFSGHGQYDSESDRDEFAMTGAEQRAHLITAGELASMFADYPQCSVIVLNACHEEPRVTGRLWRTAEALADSGVQTVVAMQSELSYGAAEVFDTEFYGAIVDGASVDEAVVAVRRALLDLPNYTEWLTPVVFHANSRESECSRS